MMNMNYYKYLNQEFTISKDFYVSTEEHYQVRVYTDSRMPEGKFYVVWEIAYIDPTEFTTEDPEDEVVYVAFSEDCIESFIKNLYLASQYAF